MAAATRTAPVAVPTDWVTVHAAAQRSGMSEKHFRRLANDGLPRRYHGRRLFIDYAAFQRLVDESPEFAPETGSAT